MRKPTLMILVIGLVGTVLLVIMYAHLAESDPEIGARMRVARMLRSLFRLESAVVTHTVGSASPGLQVKVVYGPNTGALPWDENGLRDVARFVDLNYPGSREGLVAIHVRAARETGSGCGRVTQELELPQPYLLTPSQGEVQDGKRKSGGGPPSDGSGAPKTGPGSGSPRGPETDGSGAKTRSDEGAGDLGRDDRGATERDGSTERSTQPAGGRSDPGTGGR